MENWEIILLCENKRDWRYKAFDSSTAYTWFWTTFRALKHLQHAIELQEEVLDTPEELILSHQETAVVLKDLGMKEEAEREMERAGVCCKRLDVSDALEVPWQCYIIHEEEGRQTTDPVLIDSTWSGWRIRHS